MKLLSLTKVCSQTQLPDFPFPYMRLQRCQKLGYLSVRKSLKYNRSVGGTVAYGAFHLVEVIATLAFFLIVMLKIVCRK